MGLNEFSQSTNIFPWHSESFHGVNLLDIIPHTSSAILNMNKTKTIDN